MKIVYKLVVICLLLLSTASAQEININSLLPTIDCSALEVAEGRVWIGTPDGGLLYSSLDDFGNISTYSTVEGLSGNAVTDISWSGKYLWVSCAEAGLNRLDISGDVIENRVITVGTGMTINSVVGLFDGNNEKVYYGLEEGGLGYVSNSLPGIVYTTENSPGLISNNVTCLDIASTGNVWIGTDSGSSMFDGNVFYDVTLGMESNWVDDIFISEIGDVYLADTAGVWLWHEDSTEWENLSREYESTSICQYDGALYVLGNDASGQKQLCNYDGVNWSYISIPYDLATHIASDNSNLYLSGKELPEGAETELGNLFVSHLIGENWETIVTDNLMFLPTCGVDYTADGSLLLGHMRGRGFAIQDGDQWEQFYRETSAGYNPGLIKFGGNILSMVEAQNGDIWATQFWKGLIRYEPDTGYCEHLTSENSSLRGNWTVRIVPHPDGPILFCSDTNGVDVLLDSEDWQNESNWLPITMEQLSGFIIRDAEPDVDGKIWFAVEDFGLVLWDNNNTWEDITDDIWTEPLSSLSGSSFSFAGINGVEIASDGSLWVSGGSGVVHLTVDSYSSSGISATHLQTIREKTDTLSDGLLVGTVKNIKLDDNDDLWVSHDAGLNRIRLREGDMFVDSYTSYRDFLNFGFGVLYSSSIISGLHGGMIWGIANDPSSDKMAFAGRRGVMEIGISPEIIVTEGPLDSAYLYPNPLIIGDGNSLSIGDVDADVTWDNYVPSGGVNIEVFNLTGQSIFKYNNVEGDTPFWDGSLRGGGFAAPGVYQVRIELDNQISIKPLAVVR